MDSTYEDFWIHWTDPADDKEKFAALSEDTGLYWTEDTADPLIINGADLEIRYTVNDTIGQIAEKYRMQKGKQFERRNLFKHDFENAWLAVQKESIGKRDEDGKLIRKYKAYFSRKFKSVVCISRITGRPQGNPSMQDKDYARQSSAKAKTERKRRIENIEKASKRLSFNPAEQLIAWAQGDDEKLGTKQPITNAQRIKSLEILAGYVWVKPKPIDPNIADKSNNNQGPTVHVTLPSNSRELDKHVLKHDSAESLNTYFANTYKEPDEVQEVDKEAGEYDEESGLFIPNNER